MSEDAEKTMDELMAELEGGGDGLDAFDKMLDKAARCSSLSCLPCCIPHKRHRHRTHTHIQTDTHRHTHSQTNAIAWPMHCCRCRCRCAMMYL